MRGLIAPDAFKASLILDKCDIDLSGINFGGEDISKLGADILYKVARNMHRADAEIYDFLAGICETTVDEVKTWGIKKLVQVVKEIVANEDFTDFFPS